jgi:hypothetical protein
LHDSRNITLRGAKERFGTLIAHGVKPMSHQGLIQTL